MSYAATTLISHTSGFDAALLELARSRRTIYEHSRISGENRTAHRMLPVDHCESSSYALEAAYRHNMAKHFGGAAPSSHISPLSHQERALHEALLLVAHSPRSIYDRMRLSGENRQAHCMLPTDSQAERTDRCSDAKDASYAQAMATYFVTKNVSRL